MLDDATPSLSDPAAFEEALPVPVPETNTPLTPLVPFAVPRLSVPLPPLVAPSAAAISCRSFSGLLNHDVESSAPVEPNTPRVICAANSRLTEAESAGTKQISLSRTPETPSIVRLYFSANKAAALPPDGKFRTNSSKFSRVRFEEKWTLERPMLVIKCARLRSAPEFPRGAPFNNS
jgi:hypothetical protein